jgi:radical SAM superfamily enzyme YgiQ (UPF0313 family)
MKVLLAQPLFSSESVVPPLGLASLASSLMAKGHDVQVIDFNLQWEKNIEWKSNIDNMVTKARRTNCDIVGLTCWGNMAPFCIEFSKKLKEEDPSLKIILGGDIATFLSEKLLKIGSIDFIVKGEGEKTIVELIEIIEKREKPSKVNGIAYREENTIISTEIRQPCDLDDLPFPAWDLFEPLEKYQKIRPYVMPLQVSRGCAFDCIFCSVIKNWYGIQRRKSPSRVIEEIDYLTQNFDPDIITFYDDTFTLNKDWVTEICKKMISKKVEVNWSILTRTDLVDDDLLKLLKAAGCNNIYYGIEHTSPKILKLIHKNIPNEISKKSIKKTIENDIFPEISVIYGFPTESKKEIIDLTDACLEYLEMGVQSVHQHILAPYPGTEVTSRYSELIIPNPLPSVVQPSLINTDLLYSYAEFAPDLWMFENFDMTNEEFLKLYFDARIKVGGKEVFL